MVQSILGMTTSLWVQRYPMTGDPYPNYHQHTAGAHFYFVGAPIYIYYNIYIYYIIYIHSCDSFPPEKKPSTLFYFGGFGGYEWI